MFEKKATVKYWKMRQIRKDVRYITPKQDYKKLCFSKIHCIFFKMQNSNMIVKTKSNSMYEF